VSLENLRGSLWKFYYKCIFGEEIQHRLFEPASRVRTRTGSALAEVCYLRVLLNIFWKVIFLRCSFALMVHWSIEKETSLHHGCTPYDLKLLFLHLGATNKVAVAFGRTLFIAHTVHAFTLTSVIVIITLPAININSETYLFKPYAAGGAMVVRRP